jgi:glycerophosphoryl diester phosphodiesterase
MGRARPSFLKVGHRGAKGYELENTLASFRKAVDLGANAVELDVRETRDKELVVCHDDTLKKVYGKDVRVDEAALSELKQVTDGAIPTLGEALGFLRRKVKKVLIELKETGFERQVLEAVVSAGMKNDVVIVSFHEEAIAHMRSLDENIETGLVYARHKEPIETALRLRAQYLVPLYRFVHSRDVEKAHRHSLKVVCWTINTKEEAQTYIAKGVDGIASDKPDIFTGVV